ncbi:MAG: hypothetical protein ACOC80_12605 [Petrotogales bacterium]
MRVLYEDKEDKCPKNGLVVNFYMCYECEYRGTMWEKKNGTITIQCKYEED